MRTVKLVMLQLVMLLFKLLIEMPVQLMPRERELRLQILWTHPSLWMSTHIGTLEGKFIGTISQIE